MFDYFYGQSGEMFSYFRVPKILFRDIKFKDLSTDAKTLYGILLDRMGLSVKNGWLDEQGRVYIIFPVQEVMDALGCADNKATKLFRELEKFGLIERKRRGLGKPNLIYVKNFADPRFRNREKNGSGAADSAQQETAKSRGNKTEWNKTEGSEPDPFSSDAEDEPDERTRLEAYFMQSLEVDLLLRACPDEEDTIHQIVNLLVDTCSSKRRMLRVAGDDKPAEVVRSRFMKLNELKKYFKFLQQNGWTTLTFTSSQYSPDPYDSLSGMGMRNAHDVIGQEFSKVAFVMNDNFQYDGNRLAAKRGYYSAQGMLYQIVTCVIDELKIVVLDNPSLYLKRLEIKALGH